MRIQPLVLSLMGVHPKLCPPDSAYHLRSRATHEGKILPKGLLEWYPIIDEQEGRHRRQEHLLCRCRRLA
jgi:hypothetical protein